MPQAAASRIGYLNYMTIGRALILGCFILFGCDELLPKTPVPKPKPVVTKPAHLVVSAESQRIKAYYSSVQTRLIAQGKLRQEYAPKDVPFDTNDLVEHFEQVALYDEYTLNEGNFIEQKTVSSLRRWNKPVRVGLYFGASVTAEQKKIDTTSVRSFSKRLARLTGLKIHLTSQRNANFLMLFLNRDEQISQIPKLAETTPQLVPSIVREIQNSPRNIFCVAYALSNADKPADYSGAVILIKGEHAQIMRDSCIQEEMTQALGLANDGPDIRPSIFNDDEEFATLTRHDEMLLKMLYDPRLRSGMTPKRARPILKVVAEDAMSQSRI